MAGLDLLPLHFQCKPSVLRSGQINFGLVSFNDPQRPCWKPTATMLQSRPTLWETHTPSDCYPNPKWIQSETELKQLFDWLEYEEEFAIHVKACAYNSVVPYVTLIQIATWQKGDFLIDAMALRDAIERVCKPVLENPKVLKIMCESPRQVAALQRDYSIYLYGIADLLEFAKIYHKDVFNYQSLLKKYEPKQYAQGLYLSSDQLITKSSHDKHIHYATQQVHLVLRQFNRLRCEARPQELAQGFDLSTAMCENFHPNLCQETTRVSPLVATFKLMTNFTLHHKVWTANLKKENFDNNKQKIVAVVEFREMLSKAMNISPEKLMTDYELLELCLTEATARLPVARLHYFKGPQHNNLLRLLCSRSPDAVMAELRATQCENCLTMGHGSKDLCIFPLPTGLSTFKEYVDFPENRELKKVYDRQLELFLDRHQALEQETKQALKQLHAFNW